MLAIPELRELLEVKIFIDTDADLRFVRRLERDLRERGRTVDEVITQYLETVRPMHHELVEPSRRWADLVVPGSGDIAPALEQALGRIGRLQSEGN